MDRRARVVGVAALLLFAGLALRPPADAGQKPKEWDPVIDPSRFVREVDNPYFPLPVGRTWSYRGETAQGIETLEIKVRPETKFILGVATTVMVEEHALDGQIEEISENWFAQDLDGNVWYFGEFSQSFENGQPIHTEGSWEAGKNGALPGIIMMADPQPGDTYFQEFAPDVAEDQAQVISTKRSEVVPYGAYADVLRTKEWTDLEPNSVEHKLYARGIGLIAEEDGSERLELIDMSR